MKLRKIHKLIPCLCVVGLGILGLMMFNPVLNDTGSRDVHAAEDISVRNGGISLIIDGWNSSSGSNQDIGSEILATNVATAYVSHDITVSVSHANSYSLQLTAADNETSALRHIDGTTIAGANGAKGKEMADNTWGYAWGASNADVTELIYYTLPAYGTTVSSLSNGLLESANADSDGNVSFTKKLAFAAKFGDDAPDGDYGTNVILSLVVDPKENTTGLGFAGYTTMQEITKAKCSSIANGTTGRLKDTRDNKIYWVAKLKDGLCWMTQNLDYDGGGEAVTSNGFGMVFDGLPAAKYYDLGFYRYTDPTNGNNACSEMLAPGAGMTTGGWGDGCLSHGWVEIDATLLTSTDIDPDEADTLHYTAGNYYNWVAATSSATCPTGWSLPIGNSTALGSFGGLLSGVTSTNVVVAPYYFVYGGNAQFSLGNVGKNGYYWSSTEYGTNGNGYSLFFTADSISWSSTAAADYGYSVRCVAR